MTKYAVGQAVPRTEDPRLLRGHGNYVDDFNEPVLAHAFMVRTPYAIAYLKSIEFD